jgi:hypothetical protein
VTVPSSCPGANALAQLADGLSTDAERIEVERHLDGCVACSELLAEVGKLAIPGTTARAWLDTDRTPAAIVATWRAAIAAVAALHEQGSVHGAPTPDHVVLDERGEVSVIASSRPTDPAYCAVELLHGAAPSTASDQFALCVGAWEALTGKRPFAGATVGALAVAMTAPPDMPTGGPRDQLAVLARGLDPDPAKRWPNLRALAAALADPPQPRRRWLVAMLALVVAGTAAVAAAASL